MNNNLFHRTHSGLNNQHLFYNVDYVIYTEGGESLSVESVEKGKFNDISIDKIFWKKILSNYSNKSFKFKAIGSKSTLKMLLEKFIDEDINNNIICTDSEFDEIFNDRINSDKIIYTYGYSWENDVWNQDVLINILNQLSGENNDMNEIQKDYSDFLKNIEMHVKNDAHFFKTSLKYFPRPNGHQKLLNCDSNSFPNLVNQQIDLLKINANISDDLQEEILVTYSNIDVDRYCYGHLLNDFCKNYIKYYLKVKHKLSGLGDDIIKRLALSNFINYLSVSINNYYFNIITNL